MDDISLLLKHEEALVLFEWLTLLDDNGDSDLCDEAQQKVLWKVEGLLEKLLPDVVMEDYKERTEEGKRQAC
jgi:hypothetical protein